MRALALAFLAAGCAAAPAPLAVPPGTRLAVVAPHPDDETLGTGGLIRRVLASGGAVRVVVLTAGDGYLEAAAALTGHPQPTPADYRRLGAVRADEVRTAAARLGVTDVVLLDGPDDGLDALWTHPSAPYVAPATGRGPFTGEALLRALRTRLAAFAPTLVVASDPRDHHRDHAAAGRFALAAARDLATRPRVLTYLVHDVVWPPPRAAGDDMPPPGDAYGATPWVSLALGPDEIAAKAAALAAHRTQWPIMGGLLERFVRRNEVFAVQSPTTASRSPSTRSARKHSSATALACADAAA